jgi:hypothetical protein
VTADMLLEVESARASHREVVAALLLKDAAG